MLWAVGSVVAGKGWDQTREQDRHEGQLYGKRSVLRL